MGADGAPETLADRAGSGATPAAAGSERGGTA